MKKYLFILVVLTVSFSVKAQDLRVIIEDGKTIPDSEIEVYVFKSKKDSIKVTSVKNGYYHFIERENHLNLAVRFKSNNYIISDIESDTKCIYIDYKPEAGKQCYVINEIFGDTIQTKHTESIKECSAITNINLYTEYEPSNIQVIKIRPKK